MPRLSGGRSGRPPDSRPSAPRGAPSAPLPTDPLDIAPPKRRQGGGSADNRPFCTRVTDPIISALRRISGRSSNFEIADSRLRVAFSLAAAVVLSLLASTAEAQRPTLNLQAGPHSQHASTEHGSPTFRFQVAASGTRQELRRFCSDTSSAIAGRPCAGQQNSHNAVKLEFDVEWQSFDEYGLQRYGGYPVHTKTALVSQDAVNNRNMKVGQSPWVWDRTVNGIPRDDQRPLRATVTMTVIDTAKAKAGTTTTHQLVLNPKIVILTQGISATEGTDTHMEFPVSMTPPPLEPVTVDYATKDYSATAGSDYTATSGTLTFAAGETAKTIRVPITNDAVSDSGELLGMEFSNPTGGARMIALGGEGESLSFVEALGQILNDEPGADDLPVVTIASESGSIAEGSDAVFTLTRTGETDEALTVGLTVAETGAMLSDSPPTSATFTTGEAESELRVATVGDDADEDDSTLTLTLTSGETYRLGTNNQMASSVTVLDDDAETLPGGTVAVAGTVVWTADMTVTDYGNGSIGAGTADLLANQRSIEGLQARHLYYHTGERKLRMAFTGSLATGSLTLAAGNVKLAFPEGRSGDSSFTWDDVAVDWSDGQTFEARVVSGSKDAVEAPDPTLKALTVSDATLSPAFDADTVTYTATVAAATERVTLSGTLNDDDASLAYTPSTDADSSTAGHQVEVAVGDTTATVTVTAADGETTRAYRVVVKRPAPEVETSTPTLSIAGGSGAEGADTSIGFTVTLDEAADDTVTVDYATSDGTATAGTDYTSTSGTLTFDVGTTSKTVSVAIADDTEDESDETFTVTLSNASGADLGTATATGTIENRTVVVETTPTLSIAGGSGKEGDDSSISFTVTLDEAATGTVTVDYATSDGTADAGDDYTSTSGTLTFDAGTTSKKISVAISDDSENESDETFTVTLSNASGAVLGTASATGTIRNRNVTPATSISGGGGKEGDDSAIAFAVSLDRAATDTVTVDYATSNGSATAGEDYTATSGTLSFAAGETSKTVSVPIADDNENESDETFTVTLSNASGAVLGTASATGTIENRHVVPLTASFEQVPAEHDGTTFVFHVRFSEDPAVSYKVLRDESFAVTGGTVQKARRVNGRNDLREIHVKPSGVGDITVTLPGGRACGTEGAICTADDKVLSNTETATVQGPPALNVADARVEEGTDATLDFVVTLSRVATGPVTVAYATTDGSATAGADYTTASGTLTFVPGTTEQRVSVPVLNDAVDDGGETLTLTLSNASGAWIEDGTATGTIENSDPLQRAWLARFGRTVGTHVTDAISDRLRGGSLESHLTIGGQRMPFGKQAAEQSQAAASGTTDESGGSALLQGVVRLLGLNPAQHGSASDDSSASRPRLNTPLGQSPTPHIDLRRILLGSSFRLALGADAADSSHPRLTAWGRVAGTTFDGREGDLSLDGDVLMGTVGVDGEWERLLAGLAVAHSRGDGSFTGTGRADAATGDLKNTLTSFHPYLRYAVTDRLDVWGTVGYGWGELTVEQHGGSPLEADMNLLMGSFGSRGVLLTAEENGGFELATRTDAMLTRTSSDTVAGLAAGDAEAHRLRLILEGSRGVAWAEGRSLTPTMQLGLRHDWGDAETGFGLELGGRVHYADPALGLTIEGAVRGLLAHEDADYEEWGASGTLRLAPGADGQGLALTLSPTWGAASSGVDGLWSRQTTAGLAPQDRQRRQGQVNLQVGYGIWLPALGGTLTPGAGLQLTNNGQSQSRASLVFDGLRTQAGALRLALEGGRTANPGGPPAYNIGLQLQLTFGNAGQATPAPTGPAASTPAVRHSTPAAPAASAPAVRHSTPAAPAASAPARSESHTARPARSESHTARPARSESHTARPAEQRAEAGDRHYFVQLGAFRHPDAADRARHDLAGDLAGLLQRPDTPRLAVLGSPQGGPTRILFAKPYPTRTAAAALCATVTAYGTACQIKTARHHPANSP